MLTYFLEKYRLQLKMYLKKSSQLRMEALRYLLVDSCYFTGGGYLYLVYKQ